MKLVSGDGLEPSRPELDAGDFNIRVYEIPIAFSLI